MNEETIIRTAVVTGGSRGIGRAVCVQLARQGCHVVVNYCHGEAAAAETVSLCRAEGAQAVAVQADVSTAEGCKKLFEEAVNAFGRVDILVNNAGVFSYLDILATPVERIERMILLHDLTLSKNCRAFGADMARRGSGYILNMSSYSVWMPFPGMALYTATKAYVRCFSKAFAKEVAERGVRVTAVCPAGVATDLYGLSPKWQHIGRRLGVLISPDSCARRGLRALWRGRRCIVPDWWNRLFVPLFFYMPDFVTRRIRRFTIRFQR